MLVELVVENYAVMEHLRVRFQGGLNLLTGETGSGKSLIVDALGLLLGGRASAEMVRTGAERARVTGIFEAPASKGFLALVEQAGLEVEGGELLIEREILANGKSRGFIGNRPVTLALLKDLGAHLADIHGQHDQQRLFLGDAQLEMLDAFADNGEALARAAGLYGRWSECARRLEDLERTERERLRLADLWSFQRREIEAAGLKSGEEKALESDRVLLKNVTHLQESAGAAYATLYDAPESALAQLGLAMRRLEETCRIDPALQEWLESLKPARIALEEASHALRDYVSRLEADPARLEQVESRLAQIEKLKRKYGRGVEEMLGYLEEVRANLDAAETADQRRAELQQERERLAQEFRTVAEELTQRRKDATRKLAKRVEGELSALAMEGTAFQVEIRPAEWNERGADEVAFLVSANVGEEPRPLEKVASGGEISRIALALKTCVAAAARGGRGRASGEMRTLVFDEVDAGIGGRAAEMVGRRLKGLAASAQVLCVTHLPQMASFADHHFVVEKKETNGRTTAGVREVSGDERVREIGRMLSGERLTPEALRHAEQLIRMSGGGGD